MRFTLVLGSYTFKSTSPRNSSSLLCGELFHEFPPFMLSEFSGMMRECGFFVQRQITAVGGLLVLL